MTFSLALRQLGRVGERLGRELGWIDADRQRPLVGQRYVTEGVRRGEGEEQAVRPTVIAEAGRRVAFGDGREVEGPLCPHEQRPAIEGEPVAGAVRKGGDQPLRGPGGQLRRR